MICPRPSIPRERRIFLPCPERERADIRLQSRYPQALLPPRLRFGLMSHNLLSIVGILLPNSPSPCSAGDDCRARSVGGFGTGPYMHAVQPIGRTAMDVRTAAAEPASAQRRALGALPEWDLSDLYLGTESEPLAHDLSTLADEAEAFRDRYEGRLAALSGAELGAAVEAYERLQETIGRVMSYASLVHAGNLTDPELGRFHQTMQERTNAVSTALLFFTLEINRLEDADIE